MFFTKTPQISSQDDVKLPQVLTKVELRVVSKALPYAFPSLVTAVKDNKARSRRGGENLHFPSPQVASSLNKVFNIIQTCPPVGISSNTTVPTYGTVTAVFSSLDNAGSLGAVFDQYRIKMIEVTFLPRQTVNLVQSADNPGQFVTVVDMDNATNLASFNAGTDYPGAQLTEQIKVHKHTFTPHVAVAAYSGAFTSFANEAAPWIDSASMGVIHYGVKWCLTSSTVACAYDIRTRYWLQFRNVF